MPSNQYFTIDKEAVARQRLIAIRSLQRFTTSAKEHEEFNTLITKLNELAEKNKAKDKIPLPTIIRTKKSDSTLSDQLDQQDEQRNIEYLQSLFYNEHYAHWKALNQHLEIAFEILKQKENIKDHPIKKDIELLTESVELTIKIVEDADSVKQDDINDLQTKINAQQNTYDKNNRLSLLWGYALQGIGVLLFVASIVLIIMFIIPSYGSILIPGIAGIAAGVATHHIGCEKVESFGKNTPKVTKELTQSIHSFHHNIKTSQHDQKEAQKVLDQKTPKK